MLLLTAPERLLQILSAIYILGTRSFNPSLGLYYGIF